MARGAVVENYQHESSSREPADGALDLHSAGTVVDTSEISRRECLEAFATIGFTSRNSTLKRFLMKLVLKATVLLAVIVVVYNYFWGTAEERDQAKQIISQVHELSRNVVDLLGTEKQKFDEGKYDDALTKVKLSIEKIRTVAATLGESGQVYIQQLDELEQQEQELEAELISYQQSSHPSVDANQLQHDNHLESIRQNILMLNQATDSLSSNVLGD